MTATEFRTAALLAFDGRERPALESAIEAFAFPRYSVLSPERLRQHRAEAAERLNHIDAELQRRQSPN